MENLRKRCRWIDIGDDARRQFVDAQAVFTAWEDAAKSAVEELVEEYLPQLHE